MGDEHVERRLAAILAADVVGYSRLMEADEERTLAMLRQHRRELFDPTVARHGGRIFKVMGDGFLVEFASVLKGPSVVVAHGGIARTLRVLIEHAPIIDVINWAPPQDAIMHFTPGRMELLRA